MPKDPSYHTAYMRQWRKKHRDKLNAQARQAYIDRKTLGKRRKTSQYYPSDEQIAEKNKRMAETREILGERIKRLRKERGLTHKYICESLGFSSQQSLVWERSEAAPRTQDIPVLARMLGVSTDYLLTGKEAPRYAVLLNAVKAAGVRDSRLIALLNEHT